MMEVKYGLLFCSWVIMHRKDIHVNFFLFFSARLAGPQFVKIQTFCFHGNTTWQLLPSTTKPSNFTGKLHLHTSTKTFCQWPQIYMHPRLKWETTIYIYIYIFLTSDNLLKCAMKTHFYDQAMIIHVQCTVSISTWPKGGVKFSGFVVFR